jgi:hypothetical protein
LPTEFRKISAPFVAIEQVPKCFSLVFRESGYFTELETCFRREAAGMDFEVGVFARFRAGPRYSGGIVTGLPIAFLEVGRG